MTSGGVFPLQSLVPRWMVTRSGGVGDVASDLLRMPSIPLMVQLQERAQEMY